MKKLLLLSFLFLGLACAHGQNFISKVWQDTMETRIYGTAVDFGGLTDSLRMDISYPKNDNAPAGSRPLMLLIHGGAFSSGSRTDGNIVGMRRDFAQRGYVTAAIDYRLGMFQSSANPAPHCNVPAAFGEWDCTNQTDTLEWIRAWYRGIQDAHGALRYLMNNAAYFKINPNKVFVVGESAGAFIALGVGFMDHPSEIPYGVGALPNVLAPNSIYDQGCVQKLHWAPNIASLNLARPNLGSYLGTMNPSSTPYRILGVGDFYGATFNNLFNAYANNAQIPCLYMFHRSNDILVPGNRQKMLSKYSICTGSTFGCAPIINRPYVSGSWDIKATINQRAAQNLPRPQYMAELLTFNLECDWWSHQIDNYGLRTGNMATFFAPRVLAAQKTDNATMQVPVEADILLYPNPTSGEFNVTLPEGLDPKSVAVVDLMGKSVYEAPISSQSFSIELPHGTSAGIYLVRLNTVQGTFIRRVVLR
ncbi:MAG: carboxylesterase family protein [Bacteroidia bacterium]